VQDEVRKIRNPGGIPGLDLSGVPGMIMRPVQAEGMERFSKRKIRKHIWSVGRQKEIAQVGRVEYNFREPLAVSCPIKSHIEITLAVTPRSTRMRLKNHGINTSIPAVSDVGKAGGCP
jgi:hypothetical protein